MAHAISLKPSTQPEIRHATRLLSMVHELHKAGYQRIRISAAMSPSGMHRRCDLTHVGNIAEDGHTLCDWNTDAAHYSSADGDHYFRWPDAPGRSARELAARFIERFPNIVARGDGRDWAYAGWLTEILGRAELGGHNSVPILYKEYPSALDHQLLPPAP